MVWESESSFNPACYDIHSLRHFIPKVIVTWILFIYSPRGKIWPQVYLPSSRDPSSRRAVQRQLPNKKGHLLHFGVSETGASDDDRAEPHECMTLCVSTLVHVHIVSARLSPRPGLSPRLLCTLIRMQWIINQIFACGEFKTQTI